MNRYMKVLVAGAAVAVIGGSILATPVSAAGLKDIDSYWGKAAVQYFYDNHYVSGVNGNFRPNDPVTREGIASIINNMLQSEDKVMTTDFKDMQGRWSQRAVASMVDKQIMSGYKDNTFRPTENLTREEFAVIAYNYMSYKGMTTTEKAPAYRDSAQISSWAKKAVDTVSAAGYMSGSNGAFQPKQVVTRGEAVNVLYRMLKGTEKAAATMGQKSQEELAFKDITTVYGSVKNFAKDGIMYWQGDVLHIGVKNQANRTKLEQTIKSDDALKDGKVVVQRSSYSYTDYKNMMSRAETVYRATEPTATVVTVEPDYINEKVVLKVNSISKDTQQALNKELGSALRIIIQ
ncbi:MAG: S-layer homology domain-containing protein [Megasphaera sp.]|nr:S-layer homology domain-containing protein [Megasphaera sp.]